MRRRGRICFYGEYRGWWQYIYMFICGRNHICVCGGEGRGGREEEGGRRRKGTEMRGQKRRGEGRLEGEGWKGEGKGEVRIGEGMIYLKGK